MNTTIFQIGQKIKLPNNLLLTPSGAEDLKKQNKLKVRYYPIIEISEDSITLQVGKNEHEKKIDTTTKLFNISNF